MIDVECWMVDGGFIQNSKLLIQNFAVCAECAFPKEHRSFQSSVFRGEAGLGQEEIQAVHSCRSTWAGIPRLR